MKGVRSRSKDGDETAIDCVRGFETARVALAKYSLGRTPRGTSPQESAAIMKIEFDKWKQIIVAGNIKAEN